MTALPTFREPADATRNVAHLLRAQRRRRGMTQQQLADLSTVSVRAIRDLETGMTLRPRICTLELLADALRMAATTRRELFAHTGSEDAPQLGSQPPRHHLIGRNNLLARAQVWAAHSKDRVLALTGLPGVGKTALAHALLQVWESEGWLTFWWAYRGTAGSSARHLGAVVEPMMKELLGSRDDLGPTLSALVRHVGTRPAVLLLDAAAVAPRRRLLEKLLARCPGLRLVYTSVIPLHLPQERILPVEVLLGQGAVEGEGELELAQLAVDVLKAGALGERWTQRERELAAKVCLAVDGLPAALHMLGPAVALHGPGVVLQCLRENTLGFLAMHTSDPDDPLGEAFPSRVQEALSTLSPSAQAVLMMMAERPPGGRVGLDLLVDELNVPLWAVADALSELHARGLVRRCGAAAFTVPHLVAAVLNPPPADDPSHSHTPQERS